MLIECGLSEVFFGGARGGGKTDGVLGKYAIKATKYGQHFNALFCRRELPMLDDAIERSRDIYGPLGARYNEQKKEWRFMGGGRVRFRPLESYWDADKYQGQNITDACIEEAGLYPDSRPIDRMQGVLRSAAGVPTQLILTGNPGGAGQSWIKARYIDPNPRGLQVLSRGHRAGPTGFRAGVSYKYVFIPSRVQDNKLLLARDPGYIGRLHLVGSEQLVRAWLEGDWSAIEGAFFDCWDPKRNVIDKFPVPADWRRFRSADWGFAKPFAIQWWAVVGDDKRINDDITLPRGALLQYREWYGCENDQPNVGLRLTAEEVGAEIKNIEDEAGEEITFGVLDPSAFAQDGGPSIGERMGVAGAWFQPADNKRVARAGAMGGWDMMRSRINGESEDRPMLCVFPNCVNFIRTVPALQHDPMRAEDLDTEAEDHAADAARYACMSRPWLPPSDAAIDRQANPSGYRQVNNQLPENDWVTV